MLLKLFGANLLQRNSSVFSFHAVWDFHTLSPSKPPFGYLSTPNLITGWKAFKETKLISFPSMLYVLISLFWSVFEKSWTFQSMFSKSSSRATAQICGWWDDTDLHPPIELYRSPKIRINLEEKCNFSYFLDMMSSHPDLDPPKLFPGKSQTHQFTCEGSPSLWISPIKISFTGPKVKKCWKKGEKSLLNASILDST